MGYKVQSECTFKEVDIITYKTEVIGWQIQLGPNNAKNLTGEFISADD